MLIGYRRGGWVGERVGGVESDQRRGDFQRDGDRLVGSRVVGRVRRRSGGSGKGWWSGERSDAEKGVLGWREGRCG